MRTMKLLTGSGGPERSNLARFLEFYGEVHRRLGENLAGRQTKGEGGNRLIRTGEARLAELNDGGKHLRGALAYIGYRMLRDRPLEPADGLAEAYELFQTAILVHDDIIDRSDRRRGKETLHSRYRRELSQGGAVPAKAALDAGQGIALCLGDLGLYLAEERLAEGCGNSTEFPRLLSWFHHIIMQTIRGELLDVQLSHLERYGLPYDDGGAGPEGMVLDIYHLKTACYTVIGPLCSGLLLGGASPKLLKEIETVADDLGQLFQMQDDLLGIYGNPEKLGKPVGSDVSEYKQTLLYAYVKRRGGAALETLRRYYGKPELSSGELDAVRKLFLDCGAVDHVKGEIAHRFDRALQNLASVKELPEERKTLLFGFSEYLREREDANVI